LVQGTIGVKAGAESESAAVQSDVSPAGEPPISATVDSQVADATLSQPSLARDIDRKRAAADDERSTRRARSASRTPGFELNPADAPD
jgi:hypothetical protein